MKENVQDSVTKWMLAVSYRVKWRMMPRFLNASWGQSGPINQDRKSGRRKNFVRFYLSQPPVFWRKEGQKRALFYQVWIEGLVKCESKWRCPLSSDLQRSRAKARALDSSSNLRNQYIKSMLWFLKCLKSLWWIFVSN